MLAEHGTELIEWNGNGFENFELFDVLSIEQSGYCRLARRTNMRVCHSVERKSILAPSPERLVRLHQANLRLVLFAKEAPLFGLAAIHRQATSDTDAVQWLPTWTHLAPIGRVRATKASGNDSND